ncbi:MAG: DUF3945 domain-containing protein [Muribaculum sp.]|nr:DUF3945 domain-containing protein [Muribaculum sp.]
MEPTIPQEEVLIARNNETGQVGAVTGLNEDGTPKMTDVKSAKLSDLIKFSKGQNPLEAFLSNFIRQCKNPSTFGFFRVPADRYDSVGVAMADLAKDPVANAEILKDNKVDLPTDEKKVDEKVEKTVSTEETQSAKKSNSIDPEKIDWATLEATWGIKRDDIPDKAFQDMLYNRPSPMLQLHGKMFGEEFDIKAKVSFKVNDDGSVSLSPHFVQPMPDLKQEFKGVKFTDSDIDMLQKTGNLGRVVNIKDASGNDVPSFVSIDRDTNELCTHPTNVHIKEQIGKATLTNKDIAMLKSGKQVVIDYPTSEGKSYKTTLQYNAALRKLEFVPRKNSLYEMQKQEQFNTQQKGEAQAQKRGNWLNADGTIRPIGHWKEYVFTDQQKADYTAGKSVKVEITDKKGQPAVAFVKFDMEKGRPFPYNSDPDLKPAQESKTQMSVNNDGKTNEATKNVAEPLQKYQTQPKDDAQMKQQRKPKGPKI